MEKNNIPWVEKYRPTVFDDIVLSPINRQIFEQILEKNYFPNLLFYGPPGTGKTTTIINLINTYQKKYKQTSMGSIIHLNASDERGIDIIRNQIYQFVRTKSLFENGLKFVILDEVDYMTKNAQHALKSLLQTSTQNVRFCLICNYISKIDDSLKNEFISIRFNQLPKEDIYQFIRNISNKEELSLTDGMIETIQKMYNSDIRSMINFIQLNQHLDEFTNGIITDEIYIKIHSLLTDKTVLLTDFLEYMNMISIHYNVDKYNIVKQYLNYVIRKIPEYITPHFLENTEFAIHSTESNITEILSFFKGSCS